MKTLTFAITTMILSAAVVHAGTNSSSAAAHAARPGHLKLKVSKTSHQIKDNRATNTEPAKIPEKGADSSPSETK